ncbi:MAG TPA: hypothetical protein VN606_02780 [Thermoleophilaceae bacterium]|nr:hypothetical protein [Thermoleophilaceae bacterium]
MSPSPVSLQISVAPADLPHARWTLPHQLRQWGSQVDEVLFVLDGRQPELEDLLERLCSQHAHARVEHVDYGDEAAGAVAEELLGGTRAPAKDCFGKAVYSYLFGLHAARHRFVLHLDSDMMFGGGSRSWVEEAQRLFASRPDVLSVSPLPGPPSGRPFPRHVARVHRAEPFESPGLAGPALRFTHMSTRDFLLDRSRLPTLRPERPGPRAALAALAKGAIWKRRAWRAPAEAALSRAMTRAGLSRVDFLGAAPGMWSLHPPQRSREFYDALPELIRRIEEGDMPERQLGDFDLSDALLAEASR